MIPGGVSDKLGNGYEALWLSFHLLKVFSGRQGMAVTFEPVGVGGFEFSFERTDNVEWHQCKTRSSGGRWTINRLASADVLSAFKDRLETHESDTCVFVTDTDTQPLSKLCGLAKQSDSLATFKLMLEQSQDTRSDFSTLQGAWDADEAVAYTYLRCCRAESVTAHTLTDQLSEIVAAQFKGAPGRVMDRLRLLGLEELTRRLTTDDVRALLLVNGIEARDYALDATVSTQLDLATDRYIATIDAALPPLQIDSPETQSAICDWYTAPDSRVLSIAGGAGSGKSVVLRNAIRTLREAGTPVLAFRVDRYIDCADTKALGNALLDINDSPANVLAQSAGDKPPVLVVDQLDAVSAASGRRASTKDMVLELIRHRGSGEDLKVIIACRGYDLDNDAELGGLADGPGGKTLALQPLDWEEHIAPALRDVGYNVDSFTSQQIELLSLPVHLATFLKLNRSAGEETSFTSGRQLVVKLVEQMEAEVTDGGEVWSVWKALGDVADRMSRDQLLDAPAAVLDDYRNAQRRLCSAGLLAEASGRVQFAHESYFDLIFARRFHGSGQDLAEWLTASEQHLFRRTQVRQILDYLRSAESVSRTYLLALEGVLLSPEVRYHVKDAVVRWLGSLTQPTENELNVILKLSETGEPNKLMRRALSRDWFVLLEQNGSIDRWLASEDKQTRGLAINRLSDAFETHPELALATIERFAESGAAHNAETVRQVLRFAQPGSNPAPLVELHLRNIDALSVDELRNQIQLDSAYHYWRKGHATKAVTLVAATLSKLLERDPTADPFMGDGMSDHKVPYAIREIAQASPSAFLNAIAPLYAKVLRRIREGLTGHDGRRADRMFTKSFPREERWGGVLLSCLALAAQDDPSALQVVFECFDPDGGEVDLHFILEAIAVSGELGTPVFAKLIDHPNLFQADHDGDEWLPTARAAQACRPYLAEEEWSRFEDRLFDYRPEHKRASEALDLQKKEPVDGTNWRKYAARSMQSTGLTRWRIVVAIHPKLFSTSRQMAIAELNRKFDGRRKREGNGRTGGTVVSPIPIENAKKMSDGAWLRAMAKYPDDERNRFHRGKDGKVPGGANELAGVLKGLTESNPERFVALAERAPSSTNPIYIERILEGLSGAATPNELVLRGIAAAQPFWSERFDAALARLVQSKPDVAQDDAVFDSICKLACEGLDPSRTSDDQDGDIIGTQRLSDLFDRHPRAHFSGAGADRRAAWEALESVARKGPDRRAQIAALLDARLRDEPSIDVLPTMGEAAAALIEYDRARALGFLEALARKDIRVVSNWRMPRLYNWMLWRDWNQYSWIVDEMLASDKEVLAGMAHMWVAARIFDDGSLNDRFELACSSDALARRAAAHVAHEYVDASDANDERALQWLLAHSDDFDESVRKEVYDASWTSLLDRGGRYLDLALAFVDSPEFRSQLNRFIYALDDRAAQHPGLAIRAAHRILDLSGDERFSEPGSGRDLSLHNLGKLIMGAAEAHQDAGEDFSAALDLIDRFLGLDHYSVENEIDKYDRR
ncbi:MAG: hypothetical protein AAFY15_00235 [Cyanobacteria bacterium J06648_11]